MVTAVHPPKTTSESKTAPRQRLVYLDLINTVAIVWVVLLHVRFIIPDNPSSSAWWVENILSGFGGAAVPLFFMATGFTLLEFPAANLWARSTVNDSPRSSSP